MKSFEIQRNLENLMKYFTIGSSDTLTACAFGLTVFSQLLFITHKRLLQSVQPTREGHITSNSKDYNNISEMSLVELLKRGKSSKNKDISSIATTSTATGKAKKKPKHSTVTRRRRRRRRGRGGDSSSSEDSSDTSNDSSNDLSSMDEREGEEEMDMIDSLTDSSSSCTDDDDKPHPLTIPTTDSTSTSYNKTTPTLEPSSPKQTTPTTQSGRPKRQIMIAANFTMATKDHTPNQV